MMKNKCRLIVGALFLVFLTISPALGTPQYFGHDLSLLTVAEVDANKTFGAGGTINDGQLCWAAAASNTLNYTGWGNPPNEVTGPEIFDVFKNNWSNVGGRGVLGWEWWIGGLSSTTTPAGWSQLTTSLNGVIPGATPQIYTRGLAGSPTGTDLLIAMEDFLQADLGVTLSLEAFTKNSSGVWQSFGHEVTLWGYDYEPGEFGSGPILDLVITDSDDGVTQFQTYPIAIETSPDPTRWSDPNVVYFTDGPWKNWVIWRVDALQGRFAEPPGLPFSYLLGNDPLALQQPNNPPPYPFYPFTPPSPSPLPQVPEPTTLLLFCFGLMGLAGVRRKLKN